MTVGNKWLQYLAALSLSLSLPTAALASPAPTGRPLVVSAAAANRVQQLAAPSATATPDAKPNPNPWTQISWVQEFARFWQSQMVAGPRMASLDEIPSLAGVLDELRRA